MPSAHAVELVAPHADVDRFDVVLLAKFRGRRERGDHVQLVLEESLYVETEGRHQLVVVGHALKHVVTGERRRDNPTRLSRRSSDYTQHGTANLDAAFNRSLGEVPALFFIQASIARVCYGVVYARLPACAGARRRGRGPAARGAT